MISCPARAPEKYRKPYSIQPHRSQNYRSNLDDDFEVGCLVAERDDSKTSSYRYLIFSLVRSYNISSTTVFILPSDCAPSHTNTYALPFPPNLHPDTLQVQQFNSTKYIKSIFSSVSRSARLALVYAHNSIPGSSIPLSTNKKDVLPGR